MFSLFGWPRSVTLVADASVLLQDLRYGVRGSPGILGELARLGFVAAPPSVVSETERHLTKMVARHAPETALRELWEDYKRWILVVDVHPGEARGTGAEALRRRDPRDLPLVAVVQSLDGRAIIGTDDLDLISLDLAPADWLDVTRSVKEIAVVDAAELAAFLMLRGLVSGLVGLVAAARSGSTPARLVVVGLVAALVWVGVHRDRRARITGGTARVLRRYGDLLETRDDHVGRLRLASPA